MSEVRGIVLEVSGQKVHILTNSGDFVVCDTNQIQAGVGEEVVIGAKVGAQIVEFPTQGFQKNSFSFQKFAIAATFLMALVGGTWFYPTDWVYLEINPSIAMKINLYDRVIGYEGLNKDGEQVASHLKTYGNTVETAIDDSMKEIAKDGFMTAEKKNAVIIGYGSEKVKAKASRRIQNFVKSQKLQTTVASIPLQSETIKVAKAEALSPINLEIVKKNSKVKKSDWAKEVRRMEKMKTLDIIKNNSSDKTIEIKNQPGLDIQSEPAPAPTTPVNLNQPAVIEKTDAVMVDQTNINDLKQPLIKKPVKHNKIDKPDKVDKVDKPDVQIKPDKPEKPTKPDKSKKVIKPLKPDAPSKKEKVDQPVKQPLSVPTDSQVDPTPVQGEKAPVDADMNKKVNTVEGSKNNERKQLIEEQIEQIEESISNLQDSDLNGNEKKQKLNNLHQKLKQMKIELKRLKEKKD